MIMLGIMMKLFLVAFLLVGCSGTLTKTGEHVEVVTQPPSPSKYMDMGEFVASEPYDFKGDEDDCRDLIRDYAGRGGADLVMIKSKSRHPCETDEKHSCVAMRAEAYRMVPGTSW